MLGTSMLCGLIEVVLSVMPTKFLHRLFPPLVTSITVIRGAGDVLGEDIVNVLAVTDAVAAQLGRNAIDADAKIRTVSLDSVHRAISERAKW